MSDELYLDEDSGSTLNSGEISVSDSIGSDEPLSPTLETTEQDGSEKLESESETLGVEPEPKNGR